MITKQSKTGSVVEVFIAKTKEGFDLCSSEYEKDNEVKSIHAVGLTQDDIKEMIYSLQLLLKNKIDTTHIPKWALKGENNDNSRKASNKENTNKSVQPH